MNWKIVAIVFIILTGVLIFLLFIDLFNSDVFHHEMYYYSCGLTCCAGDYQSFDLTEDGHCYCTDPENVSKPFYIGADWKYQDSD